MQWLWIHPTVFWVYHLVLWYPSESLRHAVDYFPEEHNFFNLRQLENKEMLESILCLFVIDESQLETIKSSIRRLTNNFLDVKGFMYSQEIKDYEGSIK